MRRQVRRWFCAVVVLSLATPFLWIVQVHQDPSSGRHIGYFLTVGSDVLRGFHGDSSQRTTSPPPEPSHRSSSPVVRRNTANNDSASHKTMATKSTVTIATKLNVTLGKSRNSSANNVTTPTVDPCVTRYVTHSSFVVPKPNKRIIFMDGVGRLGNKMFQYAALIGLAKRHGLTPYVYRKDIVVSVFEISHVTDTKYSNLPIYFEIAAAMYDPCLETMNPDWDWRLGGYYQSWKYFTNAEDEVRKEFTFKENIRKVVEKKLSEVKVKFKGQPSVGVHIRRGDMSVASSVKKGYTVANKQYFLRAMEYFRKLLKNPAFVILSDDMGWSKRELGREKDVWFVHGNRDTDLATMASCNHSIISTGSYGWWGAWLAGGKTIYYKNFPKNGSWLATQYKADDYFPPSWIGME